MSVSDSDKEKDLKVEVSSNADEVSTALAVTPSKVSEVNDSEVAADVTAVKKKKSKAKKVVSEGIVHVRATFNNTIITITTLSGDVLCQKTAGGVGFKGSRKGTPFAAQQATEFVVKHAIDNFYMKRASIYISGAGGGRDSAMKAVRSAGLEVVCLKEMTRIPHNGCRPPKKRRV